MKKYKRPPQDNDSPWAIDPDTLINWNTMDAHRLAKAFMTSAENIDSLRLFLDDLLTKNEIEQCIKRIYAANMLAIGMPFKVIAQTSGLSSTTIARISRQIRHKKNGYCSILRKMYPSGIQYLDLS